MQKNKKKMLVAASVAGLMALSGMAASSNVFAADVNCSGVNACKGMGDCGSKGTSCHGTNACKGQGWVKVSPEVCKKIGGTVAV